MAHITLSQLRTVLGRIVTWATSKFAARNATSGKLEYADMPVVVLASMGAELDGAQISLSPGSTFFQPAGQGVGAQISLLTSDNHVVKISNPVSNVIYCNAYTDLLYRWDTAQAKMIPVGGTASGSIDISGKADLLAPANMLSPSQWPKVVLRNVTDEEVASLVEGDVFFDSGSLWYRGASGSTEIGTPSKQAIYYCLADGKMYHWNGNSFDAVSLSVEDGRLLRLKTTVVVDEIKANASYDSLPSGKTEYIYYRAGDSKLVRMYISGGSTVTEVYDPDPRVAYFNKDKGKFMYYFNGQFHNALAIDDEPTEDSSNPVSSGGVYDALTEKQDTIIAGNGIVIAQDGKTVSVSESIRTGAAAGATAVQSVSVNGSPVPADGNGNVNIEVQSGGESVVINSEGANIVDSHTNNSVLVAGSARQVKMLYDNIMQIFNNLGNYAFPNGKPQLNWVGSIDQYALSYGTLSGCSADVPAGQVNEGQIQIKLTPTNANSVFTSVQVNGVDADWEPTGDNDGSIYVNIIVNQAIVVSATAVAGFSVSLGSGSSNVTLYGNSALPNVAYEGRIDADEHYDRPERITATMNGQAVDFSASGNNYDPTTGEIEIANVTGNIVIVARAVAQSHLTLTLPNNANIICKHGNDVLGSSVEVYSGMMPYIVTIQPDNGYRFDNVPSVNGTALPNAGNIYTLQIEAGSTNDITVTASVELTPTYAVTTPSDGHIASQITDANGNALTSPVDENASIRIVMTPELGYAITMGDVTMGGQTLTEGTDYTLTADGDKRIVAIAQVTGAVSVSATSRMVNIVFKGVRFGDVYNSAPELNFLYVGEYEPWVISPLIDLQGKSTIKFFAGSTADVSNASILFFDEDGKTVKKYGQTAAQPRTLSVPRGARYARLQFPASLLESGATADAYITDSANVDIWRVSGYNGTVGEYTDFLESSYNPYPGNNTDGWIGWHMSSSNERWNGTSTMLPSGWTQKLSMVCKPGKANETPLGYGVSPAVIPGSVPSKIFIGNSVTPPSDYNYQGVMFVCKTNGTAGRWLQNAQEREINSGIPSDLEKIYLVFLTANGFRNATYIALNTKTNKVWELPHE